MTTSLRTTIVFALLAAGALATACGGGSGKDGDGASVPTAPPTVVQTLDTTPRATAEPTSVPSEAGEAPVYWRTMDNFASLRAGVPYKVLFRIANSYAEPTLRVVATQAGSEAVELQSTRAEPGAGEAAGSYYPTSITLPAAGAWQIVVYAGADTVTIDVVAAGREAQPAR